jgi:hypothetical protein
MLSRIVKFTVGVSLVASGMGMTLVGVLAFVGMPLLIVGLGLVSSLVPDDRS